MKTDTKSIILDALSNGEPWTLSSLTRLTKSTKVSTRISDLRKVLRKEGRDIVNTCQHLKGGKVRSTYQLFN